MASTSTQTDSSSSSSTPSWRYDVFLSFYGKDTRKNFTDHLHYALKQKGIIVFRDDEKLERGKNVSKELIKAIQESMYSIIVISQNFASSRWCLIELAEIVQCMRDTGRVLPIFYHVDPSYVRNQTGTFAEAFAKHEASMRKKKPKVDIEMMQKWRAALREVGNISGWHVHDRHESIVVEEISRRILNGVNSNFSNVCKDFIGIESRVEEMMTLLSIGLDDVRFVGIYGMGGIGKTTLSKAIYERVSHQFEDSCFIAGIRKETRTDHGLVNLQKQLISEILKEREINIWNEYGASRVIADRLCNKLVFIVLDDVDREDQLEALSKSHDWFGHGSRIIITSRDRHLLNRFVDNTYEVKVLNDAEALQLFSWKAFKKPHPEENYVELSKDIVNYAQGLPLALEVFGSFLFDRTMDEWKSAKDFLKENPNAEILDKLQISFDALEDLQKKLFLDIACFFKGEYINIIVHKLESFGYYPNINIKVLVDKSLITILQGKLWVHDLLQKMGQKIVCCESTDEAGRRSRLWRYEDFLHVFKNNSGTDAVKGIVLKLPLHKPEQLNVEAFSKMKKLKMLEIRSVHDYKALDNLRTLKWHGDPLNFMLSNELCVMEWEGYPFESLPTNFQPENLIELIIRYNCIKQLWDGVNTFDKLKHIDLSYSKNLIETPDLSGVPNLENLKLAYCKRLSKFHPSIGFLRWLKELDLHGCKRLKRLPDEICLESLKVLSLNDCSRFNKFPNSVGNITSLRELYLKGTAIKDLPLSFKSLSSLVKLNISDCSRLENIPKHLISGMECLEYLVVAGSAIREIPLGNSSDLIGLLLPNSFSSLSSLRRLDLSYHNLSDGAIPSDLSCLSSLYYLNLSGNKFTRILDSAWQFSTLEELDLSYCNLLDGAIPNDLSCLFSLHYLKLSGNKFTRMPDSVCQLYVLYELFLDDCRWLQVLPKLPLGLYILHVRNCPSLEMFYNQMDIWTSNEKLRSIDCSVVAAYIDYDCKACCKVLNVHPRSPLWTENPDNPDIIFPSFDTVVGCGPALVGYGIPEWFKDKSSNSFGAIQMHTDLGSNEYRKWKGYALFIVYQVKEPDCLKVHEHGNPNSRTFVCQFQVNEVDVKDPLVVCAPGVPSVGPSGFWVYIPANWFFPDRERYTKSSPINSLEASITSGNLNVEALECGASVVRQHDASEFYQVLNTISPHVLDFESYEYLFSELNSGRRGPLVYGPIKEKDSAKGNVSLPDWLNQCNLTPKKKKKRMNAI